MLTRIAIVLALAAAAYSAAQRSPNDQAYLFSADAETFLFTPLSLTFSCEAREYGYYADVSNNCQVFHICLPLEDESGSVVETAHWSFICGNGTIFDQQTLTCNYEQDSIPCDQAETLYNTVEFGKVDDDY